MNAFAFKKAAFVLSFMAIMTGAGQAGEYHGTNLPSQTPWGDTYAGMTSARDVHHGTYFHVDRPVRPVRIVTVRVLEAERSACAWEAGVCVIRPGR